MPFRVVPPRAATATLALALVGLAAPPPRGGPAAATGPRSPAPLSRAAAVSQPTTAPSLSPPCAEAGAAAYAEAGDRCLDALIARAKPYFWRPPGAGVTLPSPVGAGGDVAELFHLRYEEVNGDGLSQQVVQRVFYLPTALATQVFDGDDFWYDSSRWTFHLWRGTVRHRDGTQATIKDAGDDDPQGLGNRARGLAMPSLRAGDLIDVVYALTPVDAASWQALGSRYLGDLFAFRGAYPAARVSYVLRSRQAIAVRGVGLAPALAADDPDGWHRWVWTAGPLPAYWPDIDGPSITDSSPYVQTGSFRDWGGLADWYRTRLDTLAQVTPALRQRLLQLVPPQPTPLATTRAVWAYLARRLDYQGNETGVHGFLPAPPQTVLRTMQGDCKDGALLLATWLRIEGVPADLTLVRTWKMGGVSDGAATMAAFDHAIVYVPALNLWIDTTAPDLAIGELPASDQGGTALVVAPGQQQLRRIPIAPAGANITLREMRVTPRGPGEWELSGAITATGAEAENWRSQFDAGKNAALSRWLRRYFSQARILEAHAETGPGAAVHLRFRALIRHGDLAQAATLFPGPYAPLLASERQRQEAKRLPIRWQVTDHWSLWVGQCPAAATAPVALTSPFGALHVTRSCQAGWLTTTTALTQSATEISANDYGPFRDFWQRVDAQLNPVPTAATVIAARGHVATGSGAALASSESK